MWWHEIKDVSLDVHGKGIVQPIRFQIPRGYSEYGRSQYNQITLNMGPEQKPFLEWFNNLEKKLVGDIEAGFNLESRVKEDSLTVKYVDGFSQVFDSSDDSLMVDGHSFVECELDCLVEIDKVYSLNVITESHVKYFRYAFFLVPMYVYFHENPIEFSLRMVRLCEFIQALTLWTLIEKNHLVLFYGSVFDHILSRLCSSFSPVVLLTLCRLLLRYDFTAAFRYFHVLYGETT